MDLSNDDVLKRVCEMVAEKAGVPVEQITPQTHFQNDLHFDSLDVVEFTMGLEDEFQLIVSDEDLDQLTTVGAVAKYVAARRKTVGAR